MRERSSHCHTELYKQSELTFQEQSPIHLATDRVFVLQDG